MQAQPRIVDLFCGCGGFSLGAHRAGLPAQLAFDVDPILTSSFESNFPRTKIERSDLSAVSGDNIRQLIGGAVDGVFGGPPCQGFSSIGQRKVDDPRRTLLGHFFRIVSELKPAFFVMENVKGLGYADAKPVLDESIALLPPSYKLLGPITLDAADFGAATRRPRLFVIGYDPDRCDPLTIEDIDAAKVVPATVKDAIADLKSAVELKGRDGHDVWRIKSRAKPSAYAATLRHDSLTFTGHRRTVHTQKVIERFATVAQGEVDVVGRHPRLSWSGQCPTLRAGTGNDRGSFQSVRPIHPDEDRVITVREAARLQGFPDEFRFHPTVWHSFRMIGNSVSPIISQAIFSLIASRIGSTSEGREAAE